MVTNLDDEQVQIPEQLCLLPLRDIVVFPGSGFVFVSASAGSSLEALEQSYMRNDRLIMLAAQKDIQDDKPSPEGLYKVGTVAMVLRKKELPHGRIKYEILGQSRANIQSYVQTQPFFKVKVDPIAEALITDISSSEALMQTAREQRDRQVPLGKVISFDFFGYLSTIHDPGRLADAFAAEIPMKVADAQGLLEVHDPIERLKKVNELLTKETERLSLLAKTG